MIIMEKSTEIHRPYGQGLGDCWLVLSFLINLAKERNQIFRLSRWYAKGQWKKWAMKFNELLPLLRDNHLVELGDWEATEPKIPWQKLGEYPSAKACMIWTPNNSKKICYQFLKF